MTSCHNVKPPAYNISVNFSAVKMSSMMVFHFFRLNLIRLTNLHVCTVSAVHWNPPRNLTPPWFLAHSKNCVLLKTKDHQAVDAPACALGFLVGNAMPARLRVPTRSEAHNDGMSQCVPNSRICGPTAVVAVS